MSEWIRCSEGNTGLAWTCVLPAGHDGDHIYSLWSEIAAMAEAEIRLAEAAIKRVRDMCADKWREVEESDPLFGPPLTLTVPDVLRALEEADDE